MDMGFAFSGHAAGHQTGFAPDYPTIAFDWCGLHARLAAAHAARRSILALGEATAGRLGSFDGRAAASLAAHGLENAGFSPDVNPTDLADGKEPATIAAQVAGPTISGGRGK